MLLALATAFVERALDPTLVPIHGALEKLEITRRLTALREDMAQAAAQDVPPDS